VAQNVHQRQWRMLAQTRLREARVLLEAGEWSGAYYLSGYAIECGLKACAARTFSANTIPDLQTVRDLYSHKFESLLKVAGLDQVFQADRRADSALEVNWAIVKDWDSIQRYEMQTQWQAEAIVAAISNRRHGVMKWVRSKW
jgi:HEPN domain-containing protein